MTCAEARRAILDAEPSVLAGDGDTSLARHLRSCEVCRAAASVVLREEAWLARGMEGVVPALDLETILQRHILSDSDVSISTRPGWARGRFRSWSLALLPLAAAAALVALLLVSRSPTLPGPTYFPAVASRGLDLAVPEGTSAAIMETDNPNITVVWLF